MKEIFDNVHDAVVCDKEGRAQYPKISLKEIPGFFEKPLSIRYARYAGVVAGIALDDKNSPVGKIVGYCTGAENFEIVAMKTGKDEVLDTAYGGAAAHIRDFAMRLGV